MMRLFARDHRCSYIVFLQNFDFFLPLVTLRQKINCPGVLSGNEECNVIGGRLSVYLPDSSFANDATMSTSKTVEAMMENGLLDGCHPVILTMVFLGGPHTAGVGSRLADDDVEVTIIKPISQTSDGST